MRIKARRLVVLVMLSGVFTVCARGEEPADRAVDGKALFHEKCAMCHRVMGMGTGLLARRVDQPLLEERTDLTAEYLMEAARGGIGNMPAIPRGEVSDEQMQAIARYLSGQNKK
ncbi:cytochrome c [Emcibacter sp.]|uniref:c-type cytochrome n=1 Tax=Emcibacter sp. TaxID=1979954 RepID=UPI002AA84670|nr:cytochrome c [Emcibacter sp.]